MGQPNQTLEVPFSASYKQRIYFTSDLFFTDQQVLADALKPQDRLPSTVKLCIDSGLVEACPQLLSSLSAFASSYVKEFVLVGNAEIVSGGEACKDGFTTVRRLLDAFNRDGLDRRSYIVAVGGGAVLDAVGFAASIAHRGIRLIRVPTTTLAQADVGVAVKNAVNYFDKKNFLGTYAVPWAVINDIACLRTLSDRDFKAGFAEAVKVALLKDAKFFRIICENSDRVASRDMEVSREIIRHAAKLHLNHITGEGDPFEANESRPLDFGHWSAHRLESLSGFTITHGEAVAIGIAIDSVYSMLTGRMTPERVDEILRCLTRLRFDLNHPLLRTPDRLLLGIEEFRQHMGGRLTITMLDDIAMPIEIAEIDVDSMTTAIERVSHFDAALRA